MKKNISVRLDTNLLERLKARARLTSAGHTSLAERYISEGLRMDEHPRIYFRVAAAGRRPALRGTRLDVSTVVDTVLQNDGSIAEAAAYLGVSVADVEACVRYYADYRDEVDDWRERMQAEADRVEAAWRSREAVFS